MLGINFLNEYDRELFRDEVQRVTKTACHAALA